MNRQTDESESPPSNEKQEMAQAPTDVAEQPAPTEKIEVQADATATAVRNSMPHRIYL